MTSMIFWNFRLAVLATVFGGIALFARAAGDFDAVSAMYQGHAAYALATPLVIAVLTAMAWFVWYRRGEGHWPAFAVGAMLLIAAGGMAAASAASGIGHSGLEFAFLVYTGVSHVLYGLLEWRDVVGMLGREGD